MLTVVRCFPCEICMISMAMWCALAHVLFHFETHEQLKISLGLERTGKKYVLQEGGLCAG